MNKKVFVSSLVLVIVFLCAMYVGKIFFPEDFVLLVENERLLAIGRFIDSHPPLYYIFGFISSFITYYLYCCAVSRRPRLNWKECLIILAGVIVNRLVSFLDMNIATHISISLFFILPCVTKGNIKDCMIVYSVHGLAQVLSLSIRDLPLYFGNEITFLAGILMTLECYLWLVLFYLIYNYKKEN